MRVLMVGYEPEAVDFSDLAVPPGLNAEKIHQGIKVALEDMRSRGWTAEQGFIQLNDQAGRIMRQMLQ